MNYTPQVLALIPARSGSKSIPHKNIRSFAGKPLMVHSIEQALACPVVDRVIVSTDSEQYAEIARRHGAEAPFLRPASISGDASTDLEVFQHALRWIAEHEGAVPALSVHLRPTHPNRTVSDITEAVSLIRAHPDWDSVRSVVPAPDSPFKMWYRKESGTLEAIINTEIPEAHSRPRQLLPLTYLQNACVDVIRSATVLESGSIVGQRIGSYLMREFNDIDTQDQFASAEARYAWRDGVPQGRVFCVDIDGVLASITKGNNYLFSQPLTDNIRRVNRLYAAGNRIILFTARGSMTGIDWGEVTRRQMQEWGVSHHELHFGKPAADYYIDDRMLSIAALQELDNVNP